MRLAKILRQLRRSKVRFGVGVCATLATLLVLTKFYTFTSLMRRHSLAARSSPPNNQTCVLPDLAEGGAPSPVEISFRHIMHPPAPIACSSQPDWVQVMTPSGSHDPGQVRLRPSLLLAHPETECNFTFMQRWTDHTNRVLETISASGEQLSGIPLKSELFHVVCWNHAELPPDVAESRPPPPTGNGSAARPSAESKPLKMWRNVMTGVMRRDKLDAPDATSGTFGSGSTKVAVGPNVLLFGFDSMSRVSFMRRLPKSYAYLTATLGAVVLKGYNIVGDGTPQALIPMLTGSTERELPETRKRMTAQAHYVDAVYPFVWKRYAEAGYLNAFLEDSPQVGTFTYRLKGFDSQPTHHYMRPFYLEVQKVKSEHERLCLGSVPRHKIMMNYVEQLFDTYPDVPKFAFAFHGELSHDVPDLIEAADDDLLAMLVSLNQKGHLNNTVLMLISDHGPRFSETRETQRGKQEERLPFFSVALPEHWRTTTNTQYRHLLLNANRLTTPFDVHSTLLHLLRHSSDPSGSGGAPLPANATRHHHRAISLLAQVPLARTCADAGIEAHWCACLEFEDVALDDDHVIRAAQSMIEHINSLTEPHRQLCHRLTLHSVLSAQKYVPRSDLLRFKSSADPDGYLGDFSAKTNISDVIYQISMVANPGDCHFEFSAPYNHLSGTFTMSDEISRTNAYGQHAACVTTAQPDLRKYCICKM